MTNLSNEEEITYANKLLLAVKLLSKDYKFWWNLIPAIALTILVPIAKAPILLIVMGGIVGVLNWVAVIGWFYEALKRKH